MMNQPIRDDRIKIKVMRDMPEYWHWCSETLQIGTWDKLIPIIASIASATYRFDNASDATAFKLRFGV